MRTLPFIALALAAVLIPPVAASDQIPSAEARLQAAITKETVEGDLKAAIELYKQLEASPNRAVAAKALLRLGECYERLGNAESRKAYERVVTQFADQKEVVAEARKRLTATRTPAAAAAAVAERVVAASLPECSNTFQVSADGRVLSFLACDSGRSGVFLRDLSSGEERLVPNTERCVIALVSRDAKQVACAWMDERDSDLRILHADGSAARTLPVKAGGTLYPADWSQDGKMLLARVAKQGKPSDMVLVSSADGSTRVLKTGGGVGSREVQPRLSPDGRYVAYPANRVDAAGKAAVTTIHVMSVDGTDGVPLVEGAPTEKDSHPVWTPDGRRILFFSDRSGEPALWVVPVEEGKPKGDPELVRPTTGGDSPIGAAPDGTFFIYRERPQSDVFLAEVDPAGARLVSQPARLNRTFVGHTGGPLAWSPDGRSIAFTRSAGARMLLALRNVESGE